MIADRSFEDEAKYFPLCENCKNQTSSLCACNICTNKKNIRLRMEFTNTKNKKTWKRYKKEYSYTNKLRDKRGGMEVSLLINNCQNIQESKFEIKTRSFNKRKLGRETYNQGIKEVLQLTRHMLPTTKLKEIKSTDLTSSSQPSLPK